MTNLEEKIAKAEAYLAELKKQKEAEDNLIENATAPLKEEIDAKMSEINQLSESLNVANSTVSEMRIQNTAYSSALSAMFDGVKYVADEENPIPLTLPMYVQANMFYKTVKNDGVKNITNTYVCTKSGIASEISEEMFTEW